MLDAGNLIVYGNKNAHKIIIQLVDEHDLELMDKELAAAEKLCKDRDFALAAVPVEEWNNDLTPWPADPVFGKQGFGDGAAQSLKLLLEAVIPSIKSRFSEDVSFYLCGYSLAGLFALWAAYQTDVFSGIIAVSPSVWYPGWTEYIKEHSMQAGRVYLSLGDKEEKARNAVMSKVGDAIRLQYETLENAGFRTVLEWNPGNHFVDSELRTAKGIAWMLKTSRS